MYVRAANILDHINKDNIKNQLFKKQIFAISIHRNVICQ